MSNELTTKVVSQTFAECHDHAGSHLIRAHDDDGEFWQCGHGCDALADQDIYLEWTDKAIGATDDDGKLALMILEFEPAEY